jgi:hypothetical protein
MHHSMLGLRVTVIGLTGKQASALRQDVDHEFDLRTTP